jgi:hypothetical protein
MSRDWRKVILSIFGEQFQSVHQAAKLQVFVHFASGIRQAAAMPTVRRPTLTKLSSGRQRFFRARRLE